MIMFRLIKNGCNILVTFNICTDRQSFFFYEHLNSVNFFYINLPRTANILSLLTTFTCHVRLILIPVYTVYTEVT